jgi:hypothetical protein
MTTGELIDQLISVEQDARNRSRDGERNPQAKIRFNGLRDIKAVRLTDNAIEIEVEGNGLDV